MSALLAPRSAAALCGDGVIDPGEACDDGDTDAKGWCAPDCQAIDGPTQRLYGRGYDGDVYVLDVATQTIVDTIPAVSDPGEDSITLEASPNGRLVATYNLFGSANAQLMLIDTGTNTLAGAVDLGSDEIVPEALAFSTDSREAYFFDEQTSSIGRIDLATQAVYSTTDVSTALCPDGAEVFSLRALAASPDGRAVYGVSNFEAYLIELDLAENTVRCLLLGDPEGVFPPDTDFAHIAFSPDGRYAYSTFDFSATWFSRVTLKGGKYRTLFEDQTTLHGLSVDASCDGQSVYVLAAVDPSPAILTIDPHALTYAQGPSLDHGQIDAPQFTDLSRDGATLFLGAGPGFVWVDVTTNVATEVTVAAGIDGIALVTAPEQSGVACGAAPATGCSEGFGAASLLVDEQTAGKERVVARFAKGPAIAQLDFGNPLRPPCGSTAYAFCLYDDAGVLQGSLQVDRAGYRCSAGTATCWRSVSSDPPTGKGYGYKDADAASDGVKKLRLRSGSAGSTKILLKAQNDAGEGQSELPTGLAAGLAGTTKVTMQLVTSDAKCFSADLEQVKRADASVFKGKL